LIFRRLLAKPRFIIYPSAFVADFFGRHGAVPDRGRIVLNGVAEVLAARPSPPFLQSDSGSLTIAYCGAVVRHKGLHLLLEALRVAKIGPVKVRVFGAIADRRYAADVRKLADEMPQVDIRFYGEYGLSALPSLLGGADLAAVPSIVPETGAITASEAICCGVPVVAPAAGAFLEVVAEGRNGLLFAPGRAGSLAAIIQRLAIDETLLRELREGAAATQVRTIKQQAHDTRRIYEEAIESDRRTSTGGDDAFLRHAVERAGFAASPRP
jgi:glycosyltransferase involved in cell wall biosynthesis